MGLPIAGTRVAGPTKVAVSATSSTLATLGLTLNPATRRLILTVPTAGITWNYGTAVAASAPLLTGINKCEGEPVALKSLQFYAASSTDMWVEEIA